MIEMLGLPFMQRALLAAVISGIVAPSIGTYIVQRRMSLLGDGLGHVAIMGVGFAFLTHSAPLPVAVITCVLGAVIVELMRQAGTTSGDLGLAILFYGGLASGVMMAGMAGQGVTQLSGFLFGSLTSVSSEDLWVIGILGAAILIVTIGLKSRLFAVSADEDYARVLGLKTRWLNLLVVVVAALTVTISMRTVGLLLISALMVIPVAASQHLFVSFATTFYGAMGIGVASAILGTAGSLALDSALGATIVVTSIALLGLATLIAIPLRRRSRFVPYVEDHGDLGHIVAEEHDPDFVPGEKQRIIQHGDHIDYVHGSHRHVKHGDHYDEH